MWTLVVVGILVALLIGFFVAAACGYMAGLIGTSASPISGIGILATIISSLVVYFIASENNLFATEAGVQFATAMAIFMTSVVIAIASISNDNLQDLKTGQARWCNTLASTNCVVTWFRSRCSCNCSSS